MDREKYIEVLSKTVKTLKELNEDTPIKISLECIEDILELLKEQDEEVRNAYERGIKSNKWNHIWEAPDGSFKGRCENCGFVHFFIEGHDSQYRFCPQCGEQKQEL